VPGDIPNRYLLEPLKTTLGSERASVILSEVSREMGISIGPTIPPPDCIKILDYLKNKGGFLQIVSASIRTRLILRDYLEPD
jgi:hypothetical protein